MPIGELPKQTNVIVYYFSF